MPLVTYKGNVSSYDGTGALRLASTEEGVERVLHLNGPAMEVSDEELASLRSSYLIEEVEAEEKTEAKADDEKEKGEEKNDKKAEEKSQPATSPSVPAATPAPVVTPVSVGSDPSQTTSPTPRAGN